jgi:RND family efflux transporter MFP subunit
MKIAAKIGGIAIAIVLLVVFMAYLAGFFTPKIGTDFSEVVSAAVPGREVTVQLSTVPVVEEAAGSVRSRLETVISPLITATIATIAVNAGDQVAEGDLLAELDARELDARVAQARQNVIAAEVKLAQAEKDYERLQRIYDKDPGAVSRAELDRMQSALETARAELEMIRRRADQARTERSYTRLTSPISGRVVERYADPGDTARQGVPLMRLYDPASLRLEAAVRESTAALLVVGQAMSVRIDALDRVFKAVIEEIVPSADPGSRTFLVKAGIKSAAGLYPGMFGRLLIPLGTIEKIYVPQQAVIRVGQLEFVWIRSGAQTLRRNVRCGAADDGGRIEIRSGLKPGETVVLPSPRPGTSL